MTRTADGEGPYQRQVVRFGSGTTALPFSRVVERFMGQADSGVVLTQVTTDTSSPNREVYDPSHPDANADGFVALPNIDTPEEMVNMLSASRAYQANLFLPEVNGVVSEDVKQ